MTWVDLARFDREALAFAWRNAAPFAHVVLDDFVGVRRMRALCEALEEEPAERYADEAFEFMATAPELTHPLLRAFYREFSSEAACVFWSAVTGRRVSRASMRGFAYQPGDYLLPHTDHQRDAGRALAYAFYLDAGEAVTGGELELFACEMDGPEPVRTVPAGRIESRPDRLVVFDVGDASLHQVREVLNGNRVSLSGWFYP